MSLLKKKDSHSSESQVSKNKVSQWIDRGIYWKITPAWIIVGIFILVSALIHFYNLSAIGDANTYYTAAVEAMLDSWTNFFFVAAEPGGSVTVDKPPLGLWIEAGFAYFLGVSGFSVSLPNILAGIFSIPLMFVLVRKYFGSEAGLVAASVLAVTPVVYVTDRNNTMDGMLTFTLLLAAWAFLEAVERNKFGFLLLGGAIIGLGFNIKMLQAFLPLPAFFGMYFLASQEGWKRKVLNLGIVSVVIMVISLSWALAVDLVPAEDRPYIGSSSGNSVMELMIGYNGVDRLIGGLRRDDDAQDPRLNQDRGDGSHYLSPSQPGARPGQGEDPPSQFADKPPALQGIQPGAGGPGGSGEVGQPGILRFFQIELANEISWLLSFGLVSLVLALFSAKLRLPVEQNVHKGLILWGGWLAICVVFFSAAAFFHAYYMVMVAPALAGSIAMGWYILRKWMKTRQAMAVAILLITAGLTLGFQAYLVSQYQAGVIPLLASGILLVGGMFVLVWGALNQRNDRALVSIGMSLVLVSLLVTPLVWSILSVSSGFVNVNLPAAFAGEINLPSDFRPPVNENAGNNPSLVDFLVSNDNGGRYLVAVPNSMQGSSIVLETGRGVLYIGGFNGSDEVVGAEDLEMLVASDDLRYVLYGSGNNPEISLWLQTSCWLEEEVDQVPQQQIRALPDGGGLQGRPILYDCGQ